MEKWKVVPTGQLRRKGWKRLGASDDINRERLPMSVEG